MNNYKSKEQYIREQGEWERTRLLYYISAQVNSTKELDPQKLLPFEWDEKKEYSKSKQPTKEEIEAITKKINEIYK